MKRDQCTTRYFCCLCLYQCLPLPSDFIRLTGKVSGLTKHFLIGQQVIHQRTLYFGKRREMITLPSITLYSITGWRLWENPIGQFVFCQQYLVFWLFLSFFNL